MKKIYIKNLPGKGAGPVARRQAVQSTMEAFAGRADVNVYSFSKLEKVLSAMCKRVSTGKPTGNIQFTMEEERAYQIYNKWNSEAARKWIVSNNNVAILDNILTTCHYNFHSL